MKVRLKLVYLLFRALPTLCFNSMKVRLKQDEHYALTYNSSKFQFHEGPIKTIVQTYCRVS